MLTIASAAPALARNPLKLPGTQYEPVAWAMVDGWADDDHDAGFASFLKSCKAILDGPPSRDGQPMVGALFKVCQRAVEADPKKPGEARAFFEQNFRPVRISPLDTPDGFVTGYYEPIVEGLSKQADGFDYPLYRKPSNLLPGGRMAVAGAPVASEGKGKKKKHGPKRRLVSYYDRAAIDDGVLAGRDLEICWLKDPIDSFFAQIQGSVRVLLDDGRLMRLNYAAANGHPYYAVGRWLIDRNIVSKEEMSMDRIREWMERNPKEGEELRRKNKSYVFFRETHLPVNEEPIGAEGISLTPGRSIAVDHKLHTYGTPFFISAYLPIEGLKPDTWFKRLMIAQDTGGAIVGPARADLYFGAGDEAASVAGRLRHYGKFVMLVPKVLLPAADDEIPLPRPRPANLISDESAPSETPDIKPAAATAKSEPAKTEPVKSEPAKPEAVADVKKSEPAAAKSKPEPTKKVAKTTEKVADKTKEKVPEKKAEKSAEKPAAKKVEKTGDDKKPVKTSKQESKTDSKSGAKAKSKFELRPGPGHDPPS
jgi:membrane-bound lytic murein transglycosylase A